MIWLVAPVLVVILICAWGWPILLGILGILNINDKPSALQQIKQLMITHAITPTEVDTIFSEPASIGPKAEQGNKGGIVKTLFVYLGAIFVFAGVGTYVGMFWDNMGSVMRVLATLGVGYVLLIVLISSLHEKKIPKLVLPLTLASVFFMVGGWYVSIGEIFPNSDNWRAATLFVCGLMALHFGVLFTKYYRTIFAFTALVFCYGFMLVGLDMLGVPASYAAIFLGASLFLVGFALENSSQRVLAGLALLIGVCWFNGGVFDIVAMYVAANWASVVVGICIMSAAYGLYRFGRYSRLTSLGNFIGSILVYSGLFNLVQYTSVEIIYLGATVFMLYVSVKLHSRVLLITTSLAMLSFIGYFSAQYFSNSLGWPVTLVLMGVFFLSIGITAINLGKKIPTHANG